MSSFPYLIFLLPTFLFSQVVLTEVMFDPIGSENTDEFVEIYNLSQQDVVNLSGWRIGDGTGDDSIVDAGQGLLLLPRQYAVILDPDYFGRSTTYDAIIPEQALVLTVGGTTLGSGGLSNSKSETITLINALGQIVCQYAYAIGNEPGYSDEKINTAGPDTASNWTDSKILLGTPGRENSVCPGAFPKQVELTIQPNPFSPDGDGFEDEAVIHYRLPFDCDAITLRIFDVYGRLVRCLIPGMSSGLEGKVVWDGRDDSGLKARMGIYIITLESLNSALGKTVFAKTTSVLASTL